MNLYLYRKITFDLMCTYITFCICHQYNKSYCFIVTFERREISYILRLKFGMFLLWVPCALDPLRRDL